jgi:hypothetical protein
MTDVKHIGAVITQANTSNGRLKEHVTCGVPSYAPTAHSMSPTGEEALKHRQSAELRKLMSSSKVAKCE